MCKQLSPARSCERRADVTGWWSLCCAVNICRLARFNPAAVTHIPFHNPLASALLALHCQTQCTGLLSLNTHDLIPHGSVSSPALFAPLPPCLPPYLPPCRPPPCLCLFRPGAFCGLRLLPCPELEALLPELRRTWGEELLQDPPYSMRWMRNLGVRDQVGWQKRSGSLTTCCCRAAVSSPVAVLNNCLTRLHSCPLHWGTLRLLLEGQLLHVQTAVLWMLLTCLLPCPPLVASALLVGAAAEGHHRPLLRCGGAAGPWAVGQAEHGAEGAHTGAQGAAGLRPAAPLPGQEARSQLRRQQVSRGICNGGGAAVKRVKGRQAWTATTPPFCTRGFFLRVFRVHLCCTCGLPLSARFPSSLPWPFINAQKPHCLQAPSCGHLHRASALRLNFTLCRPRPCPASTLRTATARKRLAIPYRAVETPSERSEYAQPDVAIVLSLLSYSYDGLSREELRQAVQQLLTMGKYAQEEHYKQWLQQGQLGAWSELTAGESGSCRVQHWWLRAW